MPTTIFSVSDFSNYLASAGRMKHIFCYSTRGLLKMTFWAIDKAVAEARKTSATVAEAIAEAEGLDFNKILVGYQFA